MELYLKESKSYIYSALIKYGYSRFTLEILEYCDSKDVIKREQYYIDLLKPEYNILKKAGSSYGKLHTIETKAKIALALRGETNPMFGKKHSDEVRKKISEKRLGKPRPTGSGSSPQKIEVIDNENNTTTVYNSIAEGGKAIGINSASISKYLNKNQIKPLKKRYIIRRI
jgi:group I intron endonuclease